MFARDAGYKYSNCRIFLTMVGDDGLTYIGGKPGLSTRDCYLECDNLEPGSYQLFCEVDWSSNAPSENYVVTCYGADSANFEDATE